MSASETCSRCGEEVRWGWRHGREAYWHREDVDHHPIFGQSFTPEMAEEVRRQYEDVIRYDDEGKPYTTQEFDILRDKDAARRKRRLAELRGQDPDAPPPPPPEPEVWGHPVEPDSFPPRSGIRQVINLVEKTPGWERRRLTHARGPYLGMDGSVLSISDTVVLGARGPDLDVGTPVAVASWRDGSFDHSFVGILKAGLANMSPANATELKAWIREHPA